MLNKVAVHSILQHDGDLKLFLESEAFNVDVKHKERKEPNLGESKGMLGSLGINVGSGSKFIEHDDVSPTMELSSRITNMIRFAVVPRPQDIPRCS